LDLKKINY
jgi:hypothetical protein